MEIKSLGPMVALPSDEELDKELERRHLRDEKTKVEPVALSVWGERKGSSAADGEQGEGSSAADGEQGEVASRLATFLQQFQKDRGIDQHQAGQKADNMAIQDLLIQRENQRRKKVLLAYQYQIEFEEKISLEGCHFIKSI